MKYINKILLMMLAVLIPMASCDTEELHELNVNPQAFNEIDLNFVFTAVQLGVAAGGSSGDNRFTDWRMNIGFCGHMIQQIANAGGGIAPGDKYFNGEDGVWDFFWSDTGKNIAEILSQTGEGGFAEGQNGNLREATRILRVFNFHRLTDYYGNIPYTEAFQGLDLVLTPVYDSQQSIYLDLLNELDEATAALNASAVDDGFAGADLFFGGDIAKWKRFGYSLMLRLAMRISNVDAGAANTYVTTAVAGGVMQSNDDNVWVEMDLGPSEWTNQNGISRAFTSGDGGQPSYLSETFVEFLKDTNDPRLMIFSGGTNGDMDPANQIGLPNGLDPTTVKTFFGVPLSEGIVIPEHVAIINPDLLNDDDPYMIMSYSESEFLMAEAIIRGIGTVGGSAQEHYEAGVRAAMQMYTPYFLKDQGGASPNTLIEISDAEVDAFLSANPFDGTVENVMEQMWVSKFFNWWEAWSDWRRTGFPALTPVVYSGELGAPAINGIPRKMRIPGNEVSTNPNYSTGANLPNEMDTRIWWDGGN